MDKVDHKSKDILGGNVDKIAELFPGVVTEAQDEVTGEVRKVVDFDLLRQHLSDELVEGDRERFRLDWPGKRASILKANTPTTKTLRPVHEDSEDFDTTQNVFIEGDNFEVLKVLQESYLGKIKMIYIDPPYNTGKDFIYKDNFAADREDYEEEIGVRDDENGGKLVKNTETNGRYHSDWLSMMQERLIVARDLLTDDGVIFISIDDNEQANLKNLCDEVFGDNNFWTIFPRVTKKGGKSSSVTARNHDYVLMYTRNSDLADLVGIAHTDSGFSNKDEYFEERGAYKLNQTLDYDSLGYVKSLDYPIKIEDEVFYAGGSKDQHEKRQQGQHGRADWGWRWRWSKDLYEFGKKHGFIEVRRGGSRPRIYTKTYQNAKIEKVGGRYEVLKFDRSKPLSTLDFTDNKYSNDGATKSIDGLIGKGVFEYTKPPELIKQLARLVGGRGYLAMDFFAGSATTAQSILELNAEDGGERKYIQVQLPEETSESSEAREQGYKTIPEISRERIRRAAKKIREDYAEQIAKRDTPLDTGFRAYKLASSNFVDTAQHPNETTQASLLDVTDNIKEGRTAEDLLTEVILDLGLTLDLPIEQRDIAGHSVFFVGGNSLVACFDDSVSLDIVDGIAAEKPLRVVFKDSSFANDETRINIDIRLKQLSPDTTVQVV